MAVPRWVIEIPDHLKTQEMCNEAVRINPLSLTYVPSHQTQEMCDSAVREDPCRLEFVSNYFKTQEMCDAAVMKDPCGLESAPDHLKKQEMCNKAAIEDPSSLEYVPDWFVTQQQIELWDDDESYDDDEIIEWYEGDQKRKAQKAKIKEELMPIAWHPSRWRDWCMS